MTGAANHWPRRTVSSRARVRYDRPMPSRIRSIRAAAVFTAIVIAALTAAACGGNAPERPAANAKADGPGVLTGKISFDGPAPERTPVRMAADPQCKPGPESLSEATIVGPDMGIKNVF